MKIRRYKKVNKNLSFYTNNFGFRQPYQLLVDGTFCHAALQNQVNIADNIPRYLQGEVKILTTPCAIIEMENLGSKVSGALLILKKYAMHKCSHDKKPLPASSCFMSMIGKFNLSHYILASQDRNLQEKVRKVKGVPLLYLHMKTPVLEHPTELSLQAAKDKLTGVTLAEKEALEELKLKNGITQQINTKKRRKKKGANPLSCKKKKTKPVGNQPIQKREAKPDKDKQKRKKVKIPKHVKEEMQKNKTSS